MLELIIVIVVLAVASVNSGIQTARAGRLNRENIRLNALLLIYGDGEEGEDDMSPAERVTRMMAGLIDVTSPVAEAAAGARRQREEEGWSPTAAEQMSLPLYMIGLSKAAGAALSLPDGDDDSDTD